MEKTATYSIETTFVCKSYAFQELAMLYCPDCAPETASKTLSKWIREIKEVGFYDENISKIRISNIIFDFLIFEQ